jgi:hypothetical protein
MSTSNNYNSSYKELDNFKELIEKFDITGYEVILSIGDLDENKIGSNCGQHVMNFLKNKVKFEDSILSPCRNSLFNYSYLRASMGSNLAAL